MIQNSVKLLLEIAVKKYYMQCEEPLQKKEESFVYAMQSEHIISNHAYGPYFNYVIMFLHIFDQVSTLYLVSIFTT